MSNPYGVDISDYNISGPLISLDILYKQIPCTSGCDKCPEANGENKFWCCKTISPSMFYVEFLRVYKTVQNQWSKTAKASLAMRAIVNYLITDTTNKGCIFWDGKCMAYADRPLSCRMYAVIPKESWDKRVESIKRREGNDFYIKDQCNLVSVDLGKTITPQQDDQWFAYTQSCERKLGVPEQYIKLQDIPGGSYRTFHDHLLLEVLETDAMNKLTKVKITKPPRSDIEAFATILSKQLDKLWAPTLLKL